MSRRKALALVTVALCVGIFIGWFLATRHGDRFTRDFASVSSSADVGITVRTLQRLRAGNDTGAIELLEAHLDGALLALGSSLRSTPEGQRDVLHLQMLDLAREYRVTFPRQSISPEVDEAVTRALSLAAGGKHE
jgi:hypothetical protein